MDFQIHSIRPYSSRCFQPSSFSGIERMLKIQKQSQTFCPSFSGELVLFKFSRRKYPRAEIGLPFCSGFKCPKIRMPGQNGRFGAKRRRYYRGSSIIHVKQLSKRDCLVPNHRAGETNTSNEFWSRRTGHSSSRLVLPSISSDRYESNVIDSRLYSGARW